jgi:hypothetical protein
MSWVHSSMPRGLGSPIPEMVLPSPRTSLLFLLGEAGRLLDAPASLGGEREPAFGKDPIVSTFSLPLPGHGVGSEPPYPSVSSIPGTCTPVSSVLWICTPQDVSPTCRTATCMSSGVDISFNNFNLAAWSIKIGKQDGSGFMMSSETGLEHSFNSMVSSSCISWSVPRLCSSWVVSLSPVYNQAARACC